MGDQRLNGAGSSKLGVRNDRFCDGFPERALQELCYHDVAARTTSPAVQQEDRIFEDHLLLYDERGRHSEETFIEKFLAFSDLYTQIADDRERGLDSSPTALLDSFCESLSRPLHARCYRLVSRHLAARAQQFGDQRDRFLELYPKYDGWPYDPCFEFTDPDERAACCRGVEHFAENNGIKIDNDESIDVDQPTPDYWSEHGWWIAECERYDRSQRRDICYFDRAIRGTLQDKRWLDFGIPLSFRGQDHQSCDMITNDLSRALCHFFVVAESARIALQEPPIPALTSSDQWNGIPLNVATVPPKPAKPPEAPTNFEDDSTPHWARLTFDILMFVGISVGLVMAYTASDHHLPTSLEDVGQIAFSFVFFAFVGLIPCLSFTTS